MTSTVSTQNMPVSAPRRVRVLVPSGETSPWIIINPSATVVAIPSGTMSVQATCSFLSAAMADNDHGTSTAVAFDWSNGDVSVVTSDKVSNVTAVRFIASSGPGVGEVAT